jgi:hypothetical protein
MRKRAPSSETVQRIGDECSKIGIADFLHGELRGEAMIFLRSSNGLGVSWEFHVTVISTRANAGSFDFVTASHSRSNSSAQSL